MLKISLLIAIVFFTFVSLDASVGWTEMDSDGEILETCIIKWWGDWIGWVSTSETNRNEQARLEAFQALFNRAPDCSGPCYVPGPCDGSSCEETLLPEGCDGWGEYIEFLGNLTCENEIVCDSGEWSKYSYYLIRPWYIGDTYYYDGSWDVFCGIDTDSDGLPDTADNCPDTPNPNQLDTYPLGGNNCGDACECHADCNVDKKVDLDDLVIMKQEFLQTPVYADCNYDGKVDLADLVMMKNEFLRTDCPPCP